MSRSIHIVVIMYFLFLQSGYPVEAIQENSSIQMVLANVFVFVSKDLQEEQNPEISIFQLIEEAKLRIQNERSMNERTILIAKATAEVYAIAGEHEIDFSAVQADLADSFAHENKVCVNWQYIDEWIKQTTRTQDNPEWTIQERKQLYKAKDMYARLKKLSEQSGYDRSHLQEALSDYVVLSPGLQESIRLAVHDTLQIDKDYVEMVALEGDKDLSLLKNDRSLYVFINYNSFDDEEKTM